MKMKVFIFEDDPNRRETFTNLLAKNDLEFVHMCDNVEVAKSMLKQTKYDIAFLDHDMDHRQYVNSNESNTGYQLAKFIVEEKIPFDQVFVHSMNVVGAELMMNTLNEAESIRQLYRTPFPNLVALLKL